MYDSEFLESEYHARGTIPNYEQYFDDWKVDSAAARKELACHLDLAYGTSEKETLDLFPAPGSTRLLIFLHGGYWRSMDKADFDWIASPFVKAGISVAVPNYDLCPTVSMATIVEQCRRATAWLHQHAHEYSVRADHLLITGHSAGGHLTGMMFATDWSAYGMPKEAIAGGITLSGLFDLEPFPYLQMNSDLRLDAESAKALSPTLLPARVSAPLIAAVGALESSEFRRQNQTICDVWSQNCLAALVLDGNHHFNILKTFTDLNSPIWQSGKVMLAD